MSSQLNTLSSRLQRIDRDVEVSGEIVLTFTCPVCLGLLAKPKVLPQCGHSLCLKCADQIRNKEIGSIACPECRVESTVKSTAELQTNFLAQRAVDVFNNEKIHEEKQVIKKGILGESCPHVGFVTKSTKLCGHCDRKFCPPCLVSHIELLRIELSWVTSNFARRRDELRGAIDDTVAVVETAFRGKLEKLEDEINSATETLIEAMKHAIDQHRNDLVNKARTLVDEQKAKFHEMADWVKNTAEVDSVLADVKELSASCAFFCPSDKLANVFNLATEVDRKLSSFEATCNDAFLDDKVVFKPNNMQSCLETMEQLIKSSNVELEKNGKNSVEKWIPSEIAQFHKAADDGDLNKLKEIFDSKTLSVGCKQIIVDHKYGHSTALIKASVNGHLEVVKYLVEELHADVFSEAYRANAAYWAAKKDQLEVVKYFLSCNPDMAKFRDSAAWQSLLHAAAHGNAVRTMAYLLDEQLVPIDLRDAAFGFTPLFYSAQMGQLDAVKLLVKRGADFNIRGKQKESISGRALFGGNAEMFKFLMEVDRKLTLELDAKNNSLLHLAVMEEDHEVARCLVVDCKLNVNARNGVGNTPLIEAAKKGDLRMTKLLIELGANVCLLSSRGDTCLHVAIEHGNADLVQHLVTSSYALLSLKNSLKETPWNQVIRLEKWNIAAVLAAQCSSRSSQKK